MEHFRIVFALLFLLPIAARPQSQDLPPAAGSPAPSVETRLGDIEQRLERIEGTPAKASINSFNPAIGMALDTVIKTDNGRANTSLRAAELNLEAPVDPFLKAWAVITGSNGGVDIEEAAMQTTGLPYNLTVRAGRVFAPFGRLSQWHDHELPMVERPNSLNIFVGGESRADGIEINYLVPTPFYLEAVVGQYNKIGTDNGRVDNLTLLPLAQWTTLARLHSYADIFEDSGLDMGASLAWTPKREVIGTGGLPGSLSNTSRTLAGVDLTYRYKPAAGGLYKGIIWNLEALRNEERTFDPATGAPQARVTAYSGYSNVETKLGRVLRIGGFADLTELPNASRSLAKTFAGYLTFEITEFNRIRLQYSRVLANYSGGIGSLPGTDFGAQDLMGLHSGDIVSLQWTAVIGYHVHGFRGRWGT